MSDWTSSTKALLEQNEIFSIFDSQTLENILKNCKIKNLAPNETLVQQGPIIEKEIFVLLSGELETLQEISGKPYTLNILTPGVVFGESAILKENERAATVKAKTQANVLVIPLKIIETIITEQQRHTFYEKLHLLTLSYLKIMNQRVIEFIKSQKNIAFFFINIIVFLSLFSIALPILQLNVFHLKNPEWATSGIVAFATFLLAIRLVLLKIPLNTLGFTTHRLFRSLCESAVLSILLIALIIFIKMLLLKFSPQIFPHKKLFFTFKELIKEKAGTSPSNLYIFISGLVYAAHSFFQEVLARGALQGTIKHLLPLKKTQNLFAILLSSMIFASAHSYYGIITVLVVFIPGLFWGWMYKRHKTIYSVWFSHAMIGLTFFGFIHI